jgi:radical SAM protein with 4Fe4S-binding SPASM domain
MIELSDYFIHGEKWLHNELTQIRQDVFPNDFKLIINYTSDQYNNDSSPGIALAKLQEYLALLDFPNSFILIKTTNKNIKADLETVRLLYCSYEADIIYESISGEFIKHSPKLDSLCILPWIHLYVNPQGQIGTCCEFNEQYELGNLTNDTLLSIVNSESLKLVRTQMLSGQRPSICSACWSKEDNNLPSQRIQANKDYYTYRDIINETSPNGTVENFKLRHLDFRASNICNLKCRMCSGKFSSRIAQEEKNLYNSYTYIDLKLTNDQIQQTLDYLESEIDNLDTVNFAGGEPLIMEEHYLILDLLLKYNKTDIVITYSTNLTQLTYKNYNITDYWQKFTNISVGASIDSHGLQAMYVRSGTDYQQLEYNYFKIKDYVNFSITSCVHLLNIFNLPQLQKIWIEKHKLAPEQLQFNILVNPANMSLQVLPEHYKKLAEIEIKQHIDWLININGAALVSSWQNVLHYMYLHDNSHLLSDFFRLNDDKDQYRKEKFEEVFPEYKNLRTYIK